MKLFTLDRGVILDGVQQGLFTEQGAKITRGRILNATMVSEAPISFILPSRDGSQRAEISSYRAGWICLGPESSGENLTSTALGIAVDIRQYTQAKYLADLSEALSWSGYWVLFSCPFGGTYFKSVEDPSKLFTVDAMGTPGWRPASDEPRILSAIEQNYRTRRIRNRKTKMLTLGEGAFEKD